MIEQLPSPSEKVLGFKLSGKLHDADYKTFVPAIDAAAGTGKIRLLAQFHDFRPGIPSGTPDRRRREPSASQVLK